VIYCDSYIYYILNGTLCGSGIFDVDSDI